nr:immunoglobulin light chain junction region [Macaca mulatta]MOW64026.1 immunoglobulin light chain junction region [Macaca mulatta]
CQQYYTYPYGF